ncbi:MAG: carbohydrate kinase family protein [Trueperaceae bacterium]|nr:carbohydrate kinase family protein [Trueperaceae bacterium]
MSTPLLVLGDFAWDVLIRTNAELLRGGDTYGEVMLTPGGSAANVAVWAQRCGLATTFVGKIGRDRLGELAKEDLVNEQVSAYFVHDTAHLTGSVAVFVDHTGERSMISGKGADHYLLPSELPQSLLHSGKHLHLTAWSFFSDPPRTAARTAALSAQQAGLTLSFDPGSFQMIREMGIERFLRYTQDLGIDIFFPNYEEGSVLTGLKEPEEIAAALVEMFPRAIIVLKLDSKGALVYEGGQTTRIPPETNNLVDATGAGDSFAGAFLAHYLKSKNAVEAANFATKISAWVIEQLGARPRIDAKLKAIID